MKKIYTIIATCLLLMGMVSAKAQQVGLTIAPQGTQPYNAGTNFQVFANYNYSNISGNIQVTLNYDPSVLSFCGSPSFPAAAVITNNSTTSSTITYSFAAAAGNNQTGVIMMCFSYVCPQLCAGTSISSVISGSIAAPAQSLTSNAGAVTVNGMVNNNWTGQHAFYSFIQSSYEVTFKLTVYGSSCFKVNNPSFTVTPSIGTIVSATNASVSGNTITPLDVTSFTPGNTHIYYYTVKLPCNTPSGTAVTSSAVLKGNNCSNTSATILTLPVASYTIPATVASNPAAFLSVTAYSGFFSVVVSNIGNTPLNLVSGNNIPPVKTNSVQFLSSTQSSGITSSVTYRDCSNTPSAAYPLMVGSSNATPPLYATKADIAVNNLMPGHNASFRIYFDLSNSCAGVPSQTQYQLTSSLTYACTTNGLSQVCYSCTPGTGTLHDTAVFSLKPNIRCTYQQAPTGCFEPGDTVDICLRFDNIGEATLTGGMLNYNLPAFLTYLPGSASFTGFSSNPVYQAASNVKWSLPNIPAAPNTYYTICFKATVNANAPYGSYGLTYGVTGNGYSGNNTICPYTVNICALPSAEVEKLVKGNLDATFSASGNGNPGSTATYQVTVKNTGNTPIGNIVLVDRMPFVGDATIMTCAPRNSQFQLFPAGAVTVPGATVTYAATPNIATGWPTAATACAAAGAFGPSFQPNNLKISLSNPIPAGGTYTFSFPVMVPTGATPGQMACNSIGMICDLIDNNNNASQMNPVESNTVCLTVQPREEPPVPCTPCKEILRSVSMTGGQQQNNTTYQLQQGVLNFTTGKALQEVRISVADLSYSWENKGCADCKMPAIGRGCLFPQTATQTIGGLVWDNYSNSALPPNAGTGSCMEELIWKLGSQAPAGSYSVPLQLSLPVPTVPECCRLQIKSICFRITFKDKDCNTCDTVICIRTGTGTTEPEDCCKGSSWTSNTITWGGLQAETGTVSASLSKNVPGTGVVVPHVNVIQAKCNESYQLTVGTSYTFFAGYQCATGDCDKRVVLQIAGPGGTVSQTQGNAGYTRSFTQPGTYLVTYTAYCGGKICATCRYTLIVKKKGVIVAEPTEPLPAANPKF